MKKKLNELDPAEVTTTRIIGHANPSTGKLNRGTVADLLLLLTAAQAPVKTYANQAALLANTDLGIGYMAYVVDDESFYLYNGPSAGSIGNYTQVSGGTTREFNRTWSSELLFDKNVIHYAPTTLTEDTTFTINTDSNEFQQDSVIIQEITTDGTHAIFFETYDPFGGVGFKYVPGSSIQSGETPEAGTYAVMFMKFQSFTMANWVVPSYEVANLSPLSVPGSFAAAADGDNEMDLSWVDVDNESSYEIQYSTSGGGGPWIALTTPAADATSYAHTGLSSGTTYHYRIRAVGDGENYANSAWTITAGTTETTGDVAPPAFTFDPADTATEIAVNQPIILTSDEAIRNDDTTEVTDANADALTTVKEDDSSGADIPKTTTIDVTKKILTITPDTMWGGNQDVYAAIDDVEDLNGNALASPQSATFTTNLFTIMNTNKLTFGSDLDSYITANDAKFQIELVVKGAPVTGFNTMFAKWNSVGDQRSLYFRMEGTTAAFKWYPTGSDTLGREKRWPNAVIDGNTHKIMLDYNGALDTNDGRDRPRLYVDDVEVVGNTFHSYGTGFPYNIYAGSADSRFFRHGAQMRGLVFRADTGSGMEDIINIPIVRSGLDTSGNGIHGTWIS